jgi:preprotein translocase subunit SecD
MMIRSKRFNLYLICLLAVTLAAGCATQERSRRHQASKLDIHLEAPRDETNLSEPVPIYRAKPVMINVQRNAILTELNVKEAKVVDVVGGFAIQIQFDRQGTWLFEEFTNQNHGKHFAVRCDFGEHLKESRWLAAPIVSKGITDGVFIFTPDATREEAEQLVLGLNNVAREVQKKLQ